MFARTFLAALFFALAMAGAAENKELTAEEKAKAQALIKDLGADDFAAREGAERALVAMGGAVLPLVKETLASTQDTEVKVRGQRVVKALALEHETDPAKLAEFAREDALAKRFESASKFYAKAAERYRAQSDAAGDEAAKKDLAAQAEVAAQRQKRAEARGKNPEGEQVIQAGGIRFRVRMGVGAGGGVVVGGEGGEGDAAGGKDDW